VGLYSTNHPVEYVVCGPQLEVVLILPQSICSSQAASITNNFASHGRCLTHESLVVKAILRGRMNQDFAKLPIETVSLLDVCWL
jgi:hypothetical protein